MLLYKSNFPHEINYRGNNVTNLKYNDTSVWLAPKATGLAYFDHRILPTSGNFRFGFITTCPCRIVIRMRSLSTQRWTTNLSQTWSLTNLLQYVYESAFSVTTHLGRIDYEAGPNKFLHDSINVNSDIIVDAYRIQVYDSVDNTLLYDSGETTPVTQKSMTLVFRHTGIQSVFLFSGVATSSLSTSALKAYRMPGDTDRLTISWTSTLSVNSPAGNSAQISEGQKFYVYYSSSGASTIGQCTLSPTRPTLIDGSTVQL